MHRQWLSSLCGREPLLSPHPRNRKMCPPSWSGLPLEAERPVVFHSCMSSEAGLAPPLFPPPVHLQNWEPATCPGVLEEAGERTHSNALVNSSMQKALVQNHTCLLLKHLDFHLTREHDTFSMCAFIFHSSESLGGGWKSSCLRRRKMKAFPFLAGQHKGSGLQHQLL
jgi:hypothetical protein